MSIGDPHDERAAPARLAPGRTGPPGRYFAAATRAVPAGLARQAGGPRGAPGPVIGRSPAVESRVLNAGMSAVAIRCQVATALRRSVHAVSHAFCMASLGRRSP